MSRDSSGTYSLPAGNPVVVGTTILDTWANSTLNDVATALSDSLSRSGKGGMTAQLVVVDGSAAVPAVSFSGAPTTGIFRGSSGNLVVSTNGQTHSTFRDSGALTVGGNASNLAANLSLNANLDGNGSSTAGYGFDHTGSVQSNITVECAGYRNELNTAAASYTLPTYTHYRAQNGTLGAGSAITTEIGFHASALNYGATVYGFLGTVGSGSNRWNFYASGTAPNYLAGDLRLGNTSAALSSSVLTVQSYGTDNAAAFYITGNNSTTRNVVWFGTSANGASGAVTLNGLSIALVNVSDYRRKENVVDLSGAEERLAALRPVEFSWKDINYTPRVKGFLAHEFAEVYPTAVTGEKDAVDENGAPKYQMMSDAVVIPDLVAAVQKLVMRVAELEATIATLQASRP